ncbi:MAG TPA: lysophospholipid acyltransferase family protein [Ignavibacteriaceae bacterium]|nr:lysophospholipid acyltransferase family protein [Ignavibacteriaceae bacterium]
MKIRKIRQDVLRFIGHFFLFHLVNVLCKTLRITYSNKNVIEALEKDNSKYILAFWHGSMLIPWYLNRKKKMVALTSKSKDGDLLAKILKSWKYRVIRGSSSTGGDVALGIMVDYAKNDHSITITPDGPRGPRHKLKAGAVITAKKSSLPLILVGVGIKKKMILKSWDQFEVPKLFTKANLVFSDPIYIDRELTYEETSKVIDDCEVKLSELQLKAEKNLEN